MAGSRVGLFDNLNIPIHRDAQHREDVVLLLLRYYNTLAHGVSDPQSSTAISATRDENCTIEIRSRIAIGPLFP
jgi:hypothetical protein